MQMVIKWFWFLGAKWVENGMFKWKILSKCIVMFQWFLLLLLLCNFVKYCVVFISRMKLNNSTSNDKSIVGKSRNLPGLKIEQMKNDKIGQMFLFEKIAMKFLLVFCLSCSPPIPCPHNLIFLAHGKNMHLKMLFKSMQNLLKIFYLLSVDLFRCCEIFIFFSVFRPAFHT